MTPPPPPLQHASSRVAEGSSETTRASRARAGACTTAAGHCGQWAAPRPQARRLMARGGWPCLDRCALCGLHAVWHWSC
eukprot:4655043-Lingulodinium_polyedra.AAC.1